MDGRDPILPASAPSRDAASPAQASEPEKIRQNLERVLSSQEFRTSKRCQDFLKYVVERTLEGQAETLKERTIAMDVFGRGSEYDPADSATVRVRAGEVRKRLERYYINEGTRDTIRIEIPAGTYVPEFQPQEKTRTPELPEKISESASPKTELRPSLRGRVAAALIVLVTVAITLLWYKERPRPNALDEFWAPVTATSSPVLLFASTVPVYSKKRPRC